MYRITVIAGIQFDRDGNYISPATARKAAEKIEKWAIEEYGGITVFPSAGSWKSGSGQIVREQGTMLVVFAESDALANNFALYVRETLNQQSVMLSVERVVTRMI